VATNVEAQTALRTYRKRWGIESLFGVVLEEILQSKRDKRAAKRLLIKLMKR